MSLSKAEAKFFEYLAQEAQSNPPLTLEDQPIETLRNNFNNLFLKYSGKASDVPMLERTILARDGYEIPIRIYNNNLLQASPVLILYPGNGYLFDLFEVNAIACSRIAQYAGIRCIIVNYRLAPENPLPIPIYDGYDAAKYIATHASEFNIDANKIFLGGISSGAHCATSVAFLAQNDNNFKIHHQILLNGVYDLTQSNLTHLEFEKEDKMAGGREPFSFMLKNWGLSQKDYTDPLFSPLYVDDLSSLPPTTIIVGEYDGVRSDSENYYMKLEQDGNKCTKIVLDGQTHNNLILREAMYDSPDPAQIIANVIQENLAN